MRTVGEVLSLVWESDRSWSGFRGGDVRNGGEEDAIKKISICWLHDVTIY